MLNTILAGRIEREKRTIEAMIRLYCKKKHHEASLCSECSGILEYAMKKLNKCPFEENKPTCIYCKIHCYQKEQREKIRQIMRFSGPKMIFHHPVLAIFHIIDKKKDNSEENSVSNA